MPTISVPKSILHSFDKKYTEEEFDSMLFDFGLEVDEITETSFKIEVPANRYDLLCTNGLIQSLHSYLNGKSYEELEIKESEFQVFSNCKSRPFIACAIIRNINFNQEMYEQFIDYQDKLHQSIGRNRTLVSMGTHDFDKLSFPLQYTELPPEKISFRPFNSTSILKGENLTQFLKDTPLLKYCKLLDEKYPVIISDGNIMCLPPVINSWFSKISPETKNIFIDVTGTDFHRVNTALKLLLYNFRGYDVLSVNINNEIVTPVFENRCFYFSLSEINSETGLSLSKEEVFEHLKKMMHSVEDVSLSKISLEKEKKEEDDSLIRVKISDIRSDILHKADLIEDIEISYGFNNFKRSLPPVLTVGSSLPLNSFSRKLKTECTILGFLEVVGLVLEQRTSKNQIKIMDHDISLRYSLLPSLLKAISSNQHVSLPIKVFEVGDKVHGIRNRRSLCCVIAGKVAKIEDIQGVLSQILQKCNISYEYSEEDDDSYYKGRGGVAKTNEEIIAKFGVVSAALCKTGKVPLACTSLEIDLERVFELFKEKN